MTAPLTVKDIIDGVIRREGSTYTNRRADRGGPTKFGVTQQTLAAYRGHPVTAADVEQLTESEARAIYLQLFVVAPGFDRIPHDGIRAFVVDWGVNSGQARATRWLQRALGYPKARIDGVLGPQTLQSIATAPPRLLLGTLIAYRAYAAHAIAHDDHSQERFENGWLNRTFGFLPLLAAVLLALLPTIALAATSALPTCLAGDGHERWAMKTRALAHYDAQPLTAVALLQLPVPIAPHRAEDSVGPFERQVWAIARAYVWLVKQSPDDCDLHLQLTATPAAGPEFIAEIPARDTSAQQAALRLLGLASLGRTAHRFTTPIAVSVVGWGFFDLLHQCARDPHKGCQHGSADVATLSELHPAILLPPRN
jgi:lysozyme family protein